MDSEGDITAIAEYAKALKTVVGVHLLLLRLLMLCWRLRLVVLRLCLSLLLMRRVVWVRKEL